MGRRATNNVHTPQVTREPLKCPTCNSINTKFCYYNNYSRSQPRHFCKACRRHWTNGGALRNVPIGGTHKNKRSRASAVVSNDAAIIRTGEAFQPFAHEFICQAPHHQPRDSVAPSLPFSAGSVMMGACLDAPPPLLASGLVRQEVPIAEEVGASSIWQGLLLQGGGMELWPSVGIGGEESSEHLIGWDGSTQELLREADPSF